MTSVSIDSLVSLDLDGTDLADAGPDDAVRFTAADLSEAQSRYSRIVAEHPGARVVVDLDVHIAADARTARRELLASESKPRSGSLQYVGTASGLTSLIADIVTVRAADGVTVRPVIAASRDAVVSRIVDDVVPSLALRRSRAS